MFVPPRTSHNFKIARKDGKTYDMYEIGLLVNKLSLRSPAPNHVREEAEGRNGFWDMGTTYGGRVIESELSMFPSDLPDYALLQNEIFFMFDSREPFYLIRDREPGKRWLVKVDSEYSMEELVLRGDFSLTFISPSPFCESINTTEDLQSFDVPNWQIGMGLSSEEGSKDYSFKSTSFKLYNPSNVIVDPLEHELAITIKAVAGTYFQMQNETTGDVFRYEGKLSAGDVLILNRSEYELNTANIIRSTNRELIQLAPGWNTFTVTGTSSIDEIKFLFRFYYL
ncbi:phage tail family protein [Terribacillus sp. JSM ZJ617]|uniref:phage tail family protein n=1 Tax=Terribacillus sp. JSM ZJ617 TaxID=3342119 RepID=UPI0035A9A64D